MREWKDIKKGAILRVVKLPKEYRSRLLYEIKEIEKQGLNVYWVDNFNKGVKWDHNKNGLVLPFLLGMTLIDPVKGINKIMIESVDGNEEDAIVIKLENGEILSISENTLVQTNKGFLKASELTVDHEL